MTRPSEEDARLDIAAEAHKDGFNAGWAAAIETAAKVAEDWYRGRRITPEWRAGIGETIRALGGKP